MTLNAADMQKLADRQELADLVARYAWLVGQGRGAAVADLFCEDGEFLGLGHELRGRAVLAAFYEGAAVPGAIVPMVGNILFEIDGDRAQGVSTLMAMFNGQDRQLATLLDIDGDRGERDSALMATGGRRLLCAYYEDDCTRIEGRWLFKRRRATTYFEP